MGAILARNQQEQPRGTAFPICISGFPFSGPSEDVKLKAQ